MEKNIKLVLQVARDQLVDAEKTLDGIEERHDPTPSIETALKYARRAVESLELARLWLDQ